MLGGSPSAESVQSREYISDTLAQYAGPDISPSTLGKTIDNLSLADLNELIARAQKAIASKKDEARSEFLAKMRADAAAHGLDIDEIMGKGPGGRRKRSDAGIKLKPKYIGPNGEIYTGRGPTPKWLKSLERKGEKREKFLAK
jgi:DNA-binding protein H-NS